MAVNYKFDIGLVYRSNHNYGANMTHYALYTILKQWGYKVAMIDLPEDSPYYLPITKYDPFELYMEAPYDGESIDLCFKHKWDLLPMNNMCKAFLVGSDQLWRNYFVKGTDYYSTLDWTFDDKFTMSYGTSFGVDKFEGDYQDTVEIAQRLHNFNAISVREQSGVEIVKKLIHKDVVSVVDPVFLCSKDAYVALAERGEKRLPKAKYMAAYILDRTESKDNFILELKKILECEDHVLIEDAMVEHVYCENDILKPLNGAKNEEWLAMIRNCEWLITDSFHGTCFAIIFQKQFFTLAATDSHRGYSRIENLLGMLGLENRIVRDWKKVQTDVSVEKIDYSKVYFKLQKRLYESKIWLEDNLKTAISWKPEMNKQLQNSNKYITQLKHKKSKYENAIKNMPKISETNINPGDKVIVWGTGNYYQKYIKFVNEIFEVVSIVDSNPDKWGKVYLKKVCQDPENVLALNGTKKVIVLIENQDAINSIKKRLNKEDDLMTYNEIEDVLVYMKGELCEA